MMQVELPGAVNANNVGRRLGLAEEPDPTRHDVLVVDEFEQLYRFEFQAQGENSFFAHAAGHINFNQEGQRKVTQMAGRPDNETQGFTGFGVLPIRPEPATGFFCCYLLHSRFFAGIPPEKVKVNDLERPERRRTTYEFELPKRTDRGVSVEGPAPVATVLRPGAAAARIALGIRAVEGKRQFDLDASQIDFVNPWTLQDWSRAVQNPNDLNRPGFGADPWSLIIKSGQQRWSVTHAGGQGPVVKEDAAIPYEGVLGTLAGSCAFLNLDHLRQWQPEPTNLLIALHDGTVAVLELDDQEQGDPALLEQLYKIDLTRNQEVWRLLRGGCILGDVTYHVPGASNRALLLNLSSLTDPDVRAMDRIGAVSGTFDFRWSTDREIIVRFIQPQQEDREFEAARGLIQAAFERWIEGTALQGRVRFAPEDLPYDAKTAAHEPLPYDILISLDPLGRVDQNQSDPDREVGLPTSQLGAYALRRSYGSPTLFLGRPAVGNFPREGYFDSPTFKHFVAHEVGHALGLPHLHQAPNSPFTIKQPRQINDAVFESYGFRLKADFIDEELVRTWASRVPKFEGDKDFSIWPVLKGTAIESVMLGLPNVAIFQDVAATAPLPGPTLFDRAWLAQVYPV